MGPGPWSGDMYDAQSRGTPGPIVAISFADKRTTERSRGKWLTENVRDGGLVVNGGVQNNECTRALPIYTWHFRGSHEIGTRKSGLAAPIFPPPRRVGAAAPHLQG